MEAYAQWKGWDESAFGRFNECEARYYQWHVNRAVGGRARAACSKSGSARHLSRFRVRSRLGGDRRGALERAARGPARPDIELPPTSMRWRPTAGDLVVLFDVLEHLEPDQLITFMRKLRALLAPDGAILLRVRTLTRRLAGDTKAAT